MSDSSANTEAITKTAEANPQTVESSAKTAESTKTADSNAKELLRISDEATISISPSFFKSHDRVRKSVLKAVLEDDEDDRCMVLNTHSLFLIQQAINTKIQYIPRLLKVPEKRRQALHLSLSIFFLMREFDDFFNDTECPERNVKMMKSFARTLEKVFKLTEDELSVGDRLVVITAMKEFVDFMNDALYYTIPWNLTL
eukprot:GILI01043421.1.p1 GENE.GILI01043421.1~~GILI01043421.1.p1  ORF type:complete len:199 (+),score=34.43 GILI01043421.1:51-647(+)